MKTFPTLSLLFIVLSGFTLITALFIKIPEASGRGNPIADTAKIIQIEPQTEELDQVSEPVGELSEPVEDVPTEPLSEVSETVGQASEPVGADVVAPEELGEVSETDDQASEEIGDVSETAEEASENLPGAPVGEEYGLEEDAPIEEMPLGDREAEGRGLE